MLLFSYLPLIQAERLGTRTGWPPANPSVQLEAGPDDPGCPGSVDEVLLRRHSGRPVGDRRVDGHRRVVTEPELTGDPSRDHRVVGTEFIGDALARQDAVDGVGGSDAVRGVG